MQNAMMIDQTLKHESFKTEVIIDRIHAKKGQVRQ